MSARTAFRTGTPLLNHASIIGLSVALTAGLLGLCQRPATAATFTPVIEEFQIQRGASFTSIFFDGFDNNTLPTGEGGYSVSGPGGMTNESGGQLTMTPALGAPSGGAGNADTITRALRLATTNPVSSDHLGQANTVQVRGRFNISLPNTLPTINGQSFGIRLQDGTLANEFYPAGTPTNDIASLDLGVNAAGQLRIRFSELDLVASTNQTIDLVNFPSLPAGAAFIELVLFKGANSASPFASYRILDALFAVLAFGTLDNINNVTNAPITLFNGEAFTRAAFFSTDVETPLPAALPLFATILAGGGLIAWRRKRKAAAPAAA